MGDQELLAFLKRQKIFVLSSSQENIPWVTNAYYAIDDQYRIYFISEKSSKHSRQIAENNKVAFAMNYFKPSDIKNRKGIQGQGKCREIVDEELKKDGVKSLNRQHYPDFEYEGTYDRLQGNDKDFALYVIEPTYIKFRNDELYGSNGTKEFSFSD